MRAEELMIGDYVKLKDAKLGNINFVGPIVQIKSITGRHVLVPNAKGLLEDVTEEYLLPVPLTPEILEKNGFHPSPNYKWELFYRNGYEITVHFADGYPAMGVEPFVYLFIDFADKSLRLILEYVHELQHALRLLGIDKEIKMED